MIEDIIGYILGVCVGCIDHIANTISKVNNINDELFLD